MTSLRFSCERAKVIIKFTAVKVKYFLLLTGSAVWNRFSPTVDCENLWRANILVNIVKLSRIQISQLKELSDVYLNNATLAVWDKLYSVANMMPRGGKILAQRFKQYIVASCQMFQRVTKVMSDGKGSQLLAAGKCVKVEGSGGGSEYQCRADPDNCQQVSDTLAGITIHIGRTHSIRSKPTKRAGDGQTAANQTPAIKLIRTMRPEDDFTADASVLFEQEETDESFHDFDETMADDDENSNLDPMITPDKSHLVPLDNGLLREALEQTDFFELDENDPKQLSVPHVKRDKEEDLVASTQYVLCSICGENDPIFEPAGLHMVDVHADVVEYCPHYWKDGAPTYLTARMTEETPTRTLVSCVEECRKRIYQDTTYYNLREDGVSCYKESISKLQSRMEILKKQLEVCQASKEDTFGVQEALQTKIDELQEENTRLTVNETNHQAERQSAVEKQRDLRKQLAAAKSKAGMFSGSAQVSTDLSKNLTNQLEEAKKIQSIADQKVLLGENKIKKLQKDLNEAVKSKIQAEKLWSESQEIIKGFVEINSTETVVSPEETMDVDVEEDAADPELAAEDENKTEKKTETKKENRKKKELEKKQIKRRCKFLSWNSGCKKGAECKFLHPEIECELYVEGKCKDSNRNCNLLHNLARKKSFEKMNGKAIKSASKTIATPTQQNQKIGKGKPTEDCEEWMLGRCPHHVMGKDYCDAGKHVMGKWGKGREEEEVNSKVEELIQAGRRNLQLAANQKLATATSSPASPALRKVNQKGSQGVAQPKPPVNRTRQLK